MVTRIIKCTKSISKDCTYYIQIKRRFLFWTWWNIYTELSGASTIAIPMSFNTLQEAVEHRSKLHDKTITEIVLS